MSVRWLRSSAQSSVINMHSPGVVLDVGFGCKWNSNISSLFDSLLWHEKQLPDHSRSWRQRIYITHRNLKCCVSNPIPPVQLHTGEITCVWTDGARKILICVMEMPIFPSGRRRTWSECCWIWSSNSGTWWVFFHVYWHTCRHIDSSLLLFFYIFFWLIVDMCLSFSTGVMLLLRMQNVDKLCYLRDRPIQ